MVEDIERSSARTFVHMRYRITLLFLIFFVALSCKSDLKTFTDSTHGINYGRISQEQAKELLESDKDIVLLDVRTPDECAEGIIPGAVQMDFLSDDFEIDALSLSEDDTYLIYCRSGNRSTKAMNHLRTLNIYKIYELEGGYKKWLAQH